MSVVIVAAGRADPGDADARPPARLEGDHRRSRLPARAGLGHRHPRPSPPRRTRARALRRLPDARPDDRRSGRHRGTAGHGCRAWACSTVETVLAADKTTAPVAGRARRDRRCRSRGYEIHLGRTDGPDCARPLLDLGRPRRTARSRPTAWSPAPTSTACSPTTRFRRAFLAALGAPASALRYEARSRRRSMRWPTISSATSTSTACSTSPELASRDAEPRNEIGRRPLPTTSTKSSAHAPA